MKKLTILLPVLVFISAIVTSACGGSSSTLTATSTPSPTPVPQPAHFGQTADQILQGLKVHSLPIGVSFTYNAANDLNHDLGRPGQYTGKVNFKDTRIPSTEQGAAISVSDGGSIEVFANTTDAKNRFAYLQAISKSGVSLFVEYEYLDGVVILRISSQLTPDQAATYQMVLKALP